MEGMGSLNGLSAEALSRREKTNRPDGQKPEISEKKLKKACAGFESIFINYMLKTMRRTIPQSGTKFPGKDIYSSMIDRKVAEDLAKRGGGIGLQEMLLRQLKSGIGGQGSGVRRLED
ncbi:MAG: rod-binding protein [Desulfobacterales bacterium]|nr:rod-binding protein [Desulfobacterales bacterium]